MITVTYTQWYLKFILLVILIFFLVFLFYPLFYVIREAFILDGRFTFRLFSLMFTNIATLEAILNSLKLGLIVTVATTLLTLPLVLIFHRYRFPGKTLFSGLLLLPLIIPPFVGAIGFKQLLSRFGSVNLILMQFNIITEPIDWLGSAGFWGVVILETIHLYPIMFLNLSASLSNLDPVYDEAAQGLGAGFLHRLRTVILPLVLPGYFAGSVIVFLWSIADLGTPLIFEYTRVIPMMIFHMVRDIHANPMGYTLVVFVVFLTLFTFLFSKKYAGGKQYELFTKGYTAPREINLIQSIQISMSISSRFSNLLILSGIYIFFFFLIFFSILPHIGVILNSFSGEWFMTILPERWSLDHFRAVFTHPLALSSIKMSLFLSVCSTIVDIALGLFIAYLITRKKIATRNLLDTLTMLTLTIPGIILAFGYVACFSGTFLDPRVNPIPLLIIGYALRRLPYMVRSAYAGFLQSSITLEEASASLGASPKTTFFKITFPLIFSHVLVGGILCFAFAMLEVSDSLILAMQEKYFPITKTIWYFTGRPGDGPAIASAMGVLGMFILLIALLVSTKFLGKKMGELFKV